MKYIKNIGFIILILMSYGVHSQCILPAEPYIYAAPGATGDGQSYSTPMDLQTALNTIQPGYTLWLLGGTYNGRFHTWYSSEGTEQCPITVSSYPGEWAILNGDINCIDPEFGIFNICISVLNVFRDYWVFEDFEVTLLDNNPRDIGGERINGVNNYWGENCKFINLTIRNTTNSAIAFSKSTGGSEIYGCLIYNNGANMSSHGTDNAFYLHNSSEIYTTVENNILFNNYYKGISCWSQGDNRTEQYFNIVNNASFNNGSPSINKKGVCNIFIGADGPFDGNPNHINILNNASYHRLTNGNDESLRIGSRSNPENINVFNNLIIGGYRGLAFWAPTEIVFANNIIYTTNVHAWRIPDTDFINDNNWSFYNNKYYSNDVFQFRTTNIFAIDYELNFLEWQTNYNLDISGSSIADRSTYNYIHKDITQNKYNHNIFKVVISDFNSSTTEVDFSSYSSAISSAPYFQVRDVENYNTILSLGSGHIIEDNYLVDFDTGLTDFEQPTGTLDGEEIDDAHKTTSDFGVFLVEFSKCKYDIVLDGITEISTLEYHATNSIMASPTSNYIINSGADVIHKAGKYISFLPGFHAKSGSTFNAKIEDCDIKEIDYVGENTLSIPKNNESSINDSEAVKIFPNPTSGDVSIKSTEAIVIWELHDQFGALLSIDEATHYTQKNAELDLNTYPKGIYFLKVTLQSGETITKQIIKK